MQQGSSTVLCFTLRPWAPDANFTTDFLKTSSKHLSMTSAPIEDMPTTPDAYGGNFNLGDIETIGHFSRIGHQLALDDSKMRYCNIPVDGMQ